MGIDLPEIIIILVLALILFGPEKLPEYAAKLGRFVAHMRQASSEVTSARAVAAENRMASTASMVSARSRMSASMAKGGIGRQELLVARFPG